MQEAYDLGMLRQVVAPVAKQFGVKRVYAFGSYGRNEATCFSDLDIRIEKAQSVRYSSLLIFALPLRKPCISQSM